MVKVLSFKDAIEYSSKFSKRHLILGNGFSIACCPDIFHYGSLFNNADFSSNPHLIQVFERLETQDFEIAIRALESGALLAPIYNAEDASVAEKMRADAAALKEILLQTIAANHPNTPSEIPDECFWRCRQFLSHFLGENDGQVYTLNYDLLLYWTLMHEEDPQAEPVRLGVNDGFGNDEDDPDADYVVWHGDSGAKSAKVHFLHGALHLYDAGKDVQKYTWIRSGTPLVDQARAAINDNKFPLFVAEGTSSQKKSKIRHNAYLYQGFKQLCSNASQPKACFFIHGHSLAANDDHILHRLGKAKFPALFIGLFGDPENDSNKEMIAKAERLAGLRAEKQPLELIYYNSASAEVWG